MNDNKPPANWPDRAVGLGAGLASALLFAASTKGSGFEVALAYFSPLPLMIGAIGFCAPAALIGALTGAFLLAHAATPLLGFAYLFGFGAPALIVSALARKGFPVKKGAPASVPQFFSPGALLAVAMILAVIAAWIGVAALTDFHHGFNAALEAMLRRFGPDLDQLVENLRQLDAHVDAASIKRLILLSAPGGVAASQTLLLAVNLWLAARIVDISARLGRPWPSLPENLILPRAVAPAFVLAASVSFYGGLTGALAGAFAAAAGLALLLQGLATLHAFTRDSKYRGFLLSALWAATTVFVLIAPPFLMAFTLFGLIESVFSLRARKARRLSTRTKTE
jgi:hypothetical protein